MEQSKFKVNLRQMKKRRFGLRSGHDETKVGTNEIRINTLAFLPWSTNFDVGIYQFSAFRESGSSKFQPCKWTTRSILYLKNIVQGDYLMSP